MVEERRAMLGRADVFAQLSHSIVFPKVYYGGGDKRQQWKRDGTRKTRIISFFICICDAMRSGIGRP